MNIHPLVIQGGDELPIQFMWPFATLNFSLKHLRNVNSDVYHALTPDAGLSAIIARKHKLITTIHDVLVFESNVALSSAHKAYSRTTILASCRWSTKIVCTSNYAKQKLLSTLKLSSEKIEVIQYGLDHSVFQPLKKQSNGKTTFLFIGGGDRSSNRETDSSVMTLNAFAKVNQEYPDSELVMGGKPSKSSFLFSLSKKLGIENSVRFVGFIPEDELAKYYSMADVFVFPSRQGFGLMLLEAMGCGTPVIAFDLFDTPEYVGKGGLLINPNSVLDLQKAMLLLMDDASLRQRLSYLALENAAKFSWKKMTEQVLDLYRAMDTA